MAAKKTAALNIRIKPTLQHAIVAAAKRDHRSVANLVEVLIMQHCERVGISIPEQQALFKEPSDE